MHYDYDRWRAIRNEVTREDLGGLGNLTKCEEIRLLGETPIADGFFATVDGFFIKKGLCENWGVSRNANYSGAFGSIMLNGRMSLRLFS